MSDRFKAEAFAVRIVEDGNGLELSRGLVEIVEVFSDGTIRTAGPAEHFKPGVGGFVFRIATSARGARDLGRLVRLEPDPGPVMRADEVGLEHVSQPLARVLAALNPE